MRLRLGKESCTPAAHPPEFRRRAVELARLREKPIAAIAKDLRISESCLRGWVNREGIDEGNRDGVTSDERAELVRLRRELRIKEMEIEILSPRDVEDAYLANTVVDVHKLSRASYGAPGMHAELRMELGVRVGRKRIARLLRLTDRAGIGGNTHKKRRKKPAAAPHEDLVKRQFVADAVPYCRSLHSPFRMLAGDRYLGRFRCGVARCPCLPSPWRRSVMALVS